METLYRAGLSNAVSATALALFVACLGRILRGRPAVLHCLWLLVLVKLVTPPLFEVAIPWPERLRLGKEPLSVPEFFLEREREPVDPSNPDNFVLELLADSAIPSDPHQVKEATTRIGTAPLLDWMRLACVIWFAGTVTTLFTSIVRIRRFRVLLRDARPAEDETQEWVDDLAASLGLDRSPSVWWIDGKLAPMVWPVDWRPRLILPTELWKGLDDRKRATLIVHELAHLRRGDHNLRFFELVVTALYWWHPAVWWARQALRDCEEQCCDAWVIWALPDAAKSYAETLLETLDFLYQSDLSEPLLASGFGKVHHLRTRLTMIMTGTTPRLLGVWGTLGSLGLAVALLPVNATWRKKPEEKKDIQIVVKTDGDATTSASQSVPTISSDTPDVVAEVVTAVDDSQPGRVSVSVKSDDATSVVAAGSLNEAVSRLKAQIEEVVKKSPQSDRDKARQKALERALKELEGAAAKIKDLHVSGDKVKAGKEVRAFVIRRGEEDKAISSEKKAEIDKAQAKVKELAHELQVKQKELMEARSKLSQLMSSQVRTASAIARAYRLEKPVRGDVKPAPVTVERRYTVERPEPGQKRIDELEKKLEKLLEDVAAMKKDREITIIRVDLDATSRAEVHPTRPGRSGT